MSDKFDPRALGARCDVCYLRDKTPVPSEGNPSELEFLGATAIAILGEAPGEQEERQGRPFVGPSGSELDKALRSAGIDRRKCLVGNVCLCRPPNNDMNALLRKIAKLNREADQKARVAGQALPKPIPSPIECCRPRLLRELEPYCKFITLGKTAMTAVTGSNQSIMAVRGGLQTIQQQIGVTDNGEPILAPAQVMPTIHPAFVLRQMRWAHVFRNDLQKAGRWFRGEAEWRPPEVIYHPTPGVLRAFLAEDRLYAFDLETDGIESLTAKIRCVGVGDEHKVVICGFLGKDGYTKFYDPQTEAEVKQILIEFFADASRPKTSWNGGNYDACVLMSQWGVRPVMNIDGLLLHKSVESELPHNLAYAASLYAEAPAWKSSREDSKIALHAETDHQLFEYCLLHGTPVVLADGSRRPIEKLVSERFSGEVLSVNAHHQLEPRRVIGWHHSVEQEVQWWEIHVERERERDRGLIVTHDHLLLGPGGPTLARDLLPGSVVWDAEPRLSPDEISCVLGTLLGDSILVASPDQRKHGRVGARSLALKGSHASKSGFAQWKEKELWFVRCREGLPEHAITVAGRSGKAGATTLYQSACLRQLAELAPYIYDGADKRRLWPAALDLMGPRGWAWWYVDDGCVQKKQKVHYQESMVISTQGFPREDLDAVVAWFEERFGPIFAGKDHVLRLGARTARPFALAIAPFIPTEGRYKLPRLDDIDWSTIPYQPVQSTRHLPSTRRVVSAASFSSPALDTKVGRYLATHRYCLDVETNHNFFTPYGLVHNCSVDVALTAKVIPTLVENVRLRDQVSVWHLDQKMQAVCVDMHTVGMFVDQGVRLKQERDLLKRRYDLLKDIRNRLELPSFNPGSVYQLRDVLFEKWKLTPPLDDDEALTSSGDPSTADIVLRALLSDASVPPVQRQIIKLVRYYRKVQKVLGTYVVKLRLQGIVIEEGLGWDDDDDWIDKETREKYGLEKQGIVNPATGRMHPGWGLFPVCVLPETWVLTEEGPRQVGSIQGFGPPGSERPAPSGLRLHDGQASATVSHLQNPGVCETLEIRTILGVRLGGTLHHRIQVVPSGRLRDRFYRATKVNRKYTEIPVEPQIEWRRLDEIQVGDWVRVPIGMDVWGKHVPPLPKVPCRPRCTNAVEIRLPAELDEDLAFFMGAYNADGSLHDANGSFSIRITDTTGKSEVDAVEDAAIRLFGPACVRRSSAGLHVTSISLKSWCSALGFGRGILQKSAPTWILAAPKQYILAYLRGLALDSHVKLAGGTPVWVYTGTRALAEEVQVILLNIGVAAALTDCATEKSPNTWAVLVCDQEKVARITAITGQVIPPAPRRTRVHHKYVQRGNDLYLRVQAVKDLGLRQVLDVTIPTTHQFWANGTVSHNTGRFSSSKPFNAMNVPPSQRTMIVAQPGNVLVGADADQLEVRVAAARWGVHRYLQAFHDGKDPHSMTAFLIFGEAFCEKAGVDPALFDLPGKLVGKAYDGNGKFIGKGEVKDLRQLGKIVHLSSSYMAGVERVHKIIQSTEVTAKDENGKDREDGTTDLPYALMELRKVREMHEKWLKGAPEYERGWKRALETWKRRSFLAEPVTGRRRDFLDGEEPNEIANFDIQGGAAGLMNLAMEKLHAEIPAFKWGSGTGIIGQVHDWIGIECPESEAEKVKKLLEECMNQEHPGLPGVKFTATANVGRSMADV